MKSMKKGILVFCIFLASFFFFLVPFGAKTQGADSRFGVGAFVSNRYDWEEWDKPVETLSDLGVGWSREEFVWELIEPEKGAFEWEVYDKSISALYSSGISILGILDYSAPWATEDPGRAGADKYMPNISDWENYVSAVVNRYKGKVHYWQIWNEPNISVFFKPSPNVVAYNELLKSAHNKIQQVDINAKVVLAGTSGVDVGYLNQLRDLGASDYFDILAVHPYSLDFHSHPEYNFANNMNKAEAISDSFGGKPVWLTEFGWPTDNVEGVSEDYQAKYLSRVFLMSYLYPSVEKLFWYDLRNDGDDKNDRENNFGLVSRDYSKKASFLAYQNIISVLGNGVLEKVNSNGEGGVYDISFLKNGSSIRAVWKINGEDTLTIDNSYGKTKIKNFLGENADRRDIGVSSLTTISDSPIFIIYGPIATNVNGVGSGKQYDHEYIDQSGDLSLKSGEEKEVWIKIKNTGTATWVRDGDASIILGTSNKTDRASPFYIDGKWIGSNRSAKINESTVKPGEIATFSFRIGANQVGNGFYKEYFCPVVEGIEWMKDIGIYWGVEVSNTVREDSSRNNSSYSYQYVDQTPFLSIAKGESKKVVLRIKNTGNKNWEKSKVNLGTSKKKDRLSIFNKDWAYANRIMLDQDIVKPGEIGSFSFYLSAPDIGGIYKEYFRPVVEGLGWLDDMGIYWQVAVN